METRRFLQASLIALLYFVGFMIFDVTMSRATIACLVIILMQMMSLGAGRIRHLGIAFILVAGFYWTDILPLHKLSALALARIDEAASAVQSAAAH
jgi:hypothetical protein